MSDVAMHWREMKFHFGCFFYSLCGLSGALLLTSWSFVCSKLFRNPTPLKMRFAGVFAVTFIWSCMTTTAVIAATAPLWH